MGVGTNAGGSFLYLTVSKGFLTNSKKGIETHTYTGIFVSIERKEAKDLPVLLTEDMLTSKSELF